MDIRPFIACNELEQAANFYSRLGFKIEPAGDSLLVASQDNCYFFLYQNQHVQPLQLPMFQLCVKDIQSLFTQVITKLPDAKYQPIVQEPWGKVIYLWGPSGEQWHITEL